MGKIVVTGQESVQGSRKSMREDIYKKHISADKVPERLPYSIDTSLVELRGWKRFEMNAYPKLLVQNVKLRFVCFCNDRGHSFLIMRGHMFLT